MGGGGRLPWTPTLPRGACSRRGSSSSRNAPRPLLQELPSPCLSTPHRSHSAPIAWGVPASAGSVTLPNGSLARLAWPAAAPSPGLLWLWGFPHRVGTSSRLASQLLQEALLSSVVAVPPARLCSGTVLVPEVSTLPGMR